MKLLRCRTHGKAPWRLTIVCATCGRVYQAVPEGQTFEPICAEAVRASEFCVCGDRLPNGSARAICTACFKERAAAAGGGVLS